MQYRAATTLALAALATTATATEQQARIFTRASQSGALSVGALLGRAESDGYTPADEICAGEGSTCAEACGDGYEQCSSGDEATHCYNPAVDEKCCAVGTGSSCLANFFCSHDAATETFCCPDGMSLADCAQEYNVDGGLSADVVSSSSSVPASSSSSAAPSETPSSLSSASAEEVTTSSEEPAELTSSAIAEVTSSAVESDSGDETSSDVPFVTSSFISAANGTSFEPSSSLDGADAPEETGAEDEGAPAPEAEDDGEGEVGAESEEEDGDAEGQEESDDEEAAGVAQAPASIAIIAGIAFLAAFF